MHNDVVSNAPPQDVPPEPGNQNPYEYLPPREAGGEPAPGAAPSAAADPYADPYNAPPGPEQYETPAVEGGAYGPADDVAPTSYDSGAAGAPGGGADFAAAMESAQRQLEGGQLASALRQLSGWYDSPQLSPEERQRLTALLDQVAGTVVYSTQNLLEPPYEVQAGESLETIGEKYQVPWQLLAKINGIDDPAALRPGERLKVVRGPFQAVVGLQRRELTLWTADGLYAGRFPIGVGNELPPQEGTFAVSDKKTNPVYYGRDRAIGAEDPSNPLGERWIALGERMGIHGTNDAQSIGRTDLPGSISLNEQDVNDVYDILSLGSRVTIRR